MQSEEVVKAEIAEIEDSDSESDLDSLSNLDVTGKREADVYGVKAYSAKCEQMGIIPVSYFIDKAHLQVVSLKHHGIRSKGAAALAECLRINAEITDLDLSDNFIGEEGGSFLADALITNSTVEKLNLAGNKLCRVGGIAIADMIETNHIISTLNLSGNGLTDAVAATLGTILASSSSVKWLDISRNEFTDKSGETIANMFQHNTDLLYVNISWNKFGSKASGLIADSLAHNAFLEELDFSWNGVGDEGGKHWAEGFPSMRMKRLNLSHTRLGEAAAVALAAKLGSNTSMESLDLSDNPIGIEGIMALVEGLKTNKLLKGNVFLDRCECSMLDVSCRILPPDAPFGHYELDMTKSYNQLTFERVKQLIHTNEDEIVKDVTYGEDPLTLVNANVLSWTVGDEHLLVFDYVGALWDKEPIADALFKTFIASISAPEMPMDEKILAIAKKLNSVSPVPPAPPVAVEVGEGEEGAVPVAAAVEEEAAEEVEDIFLKCDQVLAMMNALAPEDIDGRTIVAALSRKKVVDKENWKPLILSTLPTDRRAKVPFISYQPPAPDAPAEGEDGMPVAEAP